MEHQYHNQSESLGINATSKAYLLETAKWGRFLAVMGYIFTAFMILTGFAMFSMGASFPQAAGSPINFSLLGLFYILFACIHLYPVYCLMKFSNYSKKAVLMNNEEMMTEALGNLKTIFKFFGILTIIILALYAVIFLIGIAAIIGAGISA